MHPTLRVLLMLIGCASPLLTYAALWQVKEWRIDRLKEHLRAEGFFRQLFGTMRPTIVLLGIGASVVTRVSEVFVADCVLALLALLSCAQIILRKQRFPVRTAKAIILVATTLVLDAILIGIISIWMLPPYPWIHVFMVLVQFDVLCIAWLLFLPIDTYMKARIMRKAKALRAEFSDVTAIGITGSVGKTTTKELLAHMLRDQHVLCTPAYVNSEMGVAKWMLKELASRKRDEPLTIIVEMGAYRMGEIAKLCEMVQPSIGVVTYIGSQHVALFGSPERLFAAKSELVRSLPQHGQALLNGDNEQCASMREVSNAPVQTVGTGGHADIEAFDIEETGNGIRFRVQDTLFETTLHGTHNATNVLLAIGVAKQLNMSLAAIATKLKTFTPPHSTFNVRSEKGVTLLDDTHNASAASFRAAIAWAKSQPAKKKILITPGLIELGKDEARIHRELGAQAALVFDAVIFTNKQSKAYFEEGFGNTIELYGKHATQATAGDLVVCVGRMSTNTIESFLPSA